MAATPEKQLMAKVCGFIQMFLLAFVIAGETICKALGIQTPEFVKTLQSNPWLYGFMVFFLGNNIQSSLNTTGAFEIFIDDHLVYSKLATGKMPNMNEVLAIFQENGMEFK
jgi:thioredoxin reductase-like selenoprotein T